VNFFNVDRKDMISFSPPVQGELKASFDVAALTLKFPQRPFSIGPPRQPVYKRHLIPLTRAISRFTEEWRHQ
jgi:hypothetical protein